MTDIIKDLIPAGSRNRPGKANAKTHVTIHNTGNPAKGADAAAHAKYVKGGAVDVPASWHYTTDEKQIIQHVPDGEIAYHAGSKGNPCSIGIEICVNSDGDLKGATDNAARLAAYLCEKYGVPVQNVVQHNHWRDAQYPNGKDCPQLLRQGKPYSWDTFLQKVRGAMAQKAGDESGQGISELPQTEPDMTEASGLDFPSNWAKNACDKAARSGLILGDGQGWFGWKEPVTLERLLVILDKLGVLG